MAWARVAAAFLAAAGWTGAVHANWQPLLSEPGRRIEVDRASITKEAGSKVLAWGRLTLRRPLPDAISGNSFSVLESHIRFDCEARTFATLRRVFRKDESETIREEQDKAPAELPVRSGSLEDRVMRVACRPGGIAGARTDFANTVKDANKAATAVREVNENGGRKKLLNAELGNGGRSPRGNGLATGKNGEPATKSAGEPLTVVSGRSTIGASGEPSAANVLPAVPWSYTGPGAPENWAGLKPEFKICGSGQRQAPIDLRDGIAVDLPVLDFAYQPSLFRLTDRGHSLHLAVGENRVRLLGRDYQLVDFVFRRPAEVTVGGQAAPLAAHLTHRAADGRLLVLVVPFVAGEENPAVQVALNYLPLERNQSVEPPEAAIDLRELLPADGGYYTFMGSLSAPPCTEGVQWVVFKRPVSVSAAQLAIFARLYPNNARPVQAANGRLIKESRGR